jgi:phosphoribosylcarboxyaminoimidazole (NCAIR) mutase
MSKPCFATVMGSGSDLPAKEASFEVLRSFGAPCGARTTSARRPPALTREYLRDTDRRGCALFGADTGAVAASTAAPQESFRG